MKAASRSERGRPGRGSVSVVTSTSLIVSDDPFRYADLPGTRTLPSAGGGPDAAPFTATQAPLGAHAQLQDRCPSGCHRAASAGREGAGFHPLYTCRTCHVRDMGEVHQLRRYCHHLWRIWSLRATSTPVTWSSCPGLTARSWSRRSAWARADSSSRSHRSAMIDLRPSSSSP